MSTNQENLVKNKKGKSRKNIHNSGEKVITTVNMEASTRKQFKSVIYAFYNKKKTNITYFLLQFENFRQNMGMTIN